VTEYICPTCGGSGTTEDGKVCNNCHGWGFWDDEQDVDDADIHGEA